MIFKCGIIGLPNVGKSSLFNALTCSSVKSDNFPFCTIKANHGLFTILDFRLYKLFKFIRSKEIIFDNIKFIDIAGLIEGASSGEGLGNKFLNDIIEADVLCHIVRCFDQSDIYHINSNIDPKKDIEIVNDELILSDISRCERLISLAKKTNNDNRKKNIKDITRILLLEKCLGYLYNRIMLYQCMFNITEKNIIKNFNFLTYKPMIYIANIGINETYVSSSYYLDKMSKISVIDNIPCISMCILSELRLMKIKIDNLQFNNELFFNYFFKYSKIFDFINVINHILRLKTFFTINAKKTKSWVVSKDVIAVQAANILHSDFKKKFIRVQVVRYNDFMNFKGMISSKKHGKMKIEGKNYLVKDGDILNFLI